jgi:hypothetical protein
LRSYLFGLCGILLASSCTLADDVPPLEAGPALVNSRLVSGQLEMRDARNGQFIVVPKAPIIHGFPASIQTTVVLRSQPTGADLVVTAHNTSSAPATAGHIMVGILNLGQSIETFDFRATGGDPVHRDWNNYAGAAFNYPDDMYSPVFVARNGTYTVGISMQYPVMDYKHDVVLSMVNPGGGMAAGEGGPGWLAMYWLGNPQNTMTARWATLAPGETRTYVVSVRVTTNTQEWETTLLPYRGYFRSHYGGVKYTRDTTPIIAMQMADSAHLSPSNPYGFGGGRVDITGWAPVRDVLLGAYAQWPTVMLWTPSGLYLNHQERNFPFQFTTHWNATPRLAEVYSPTTGLPSAVAAGKKVGLWWGRSAEVAMTWDTGDYEFLDPDNPSHMRAVLAEMDGAARSGATLVGLDTFQTNCIPIWKAYPYLQMLEQRYPNIKFCTESSSCDILHTICPTFVTGWQSFASRPANVSDLVTIRHANYLADFINPGHETWGSVSYQEMRVWFHSEPSRTLVRDTATSFASYGYRPVLCETMDYTPLTAARTWETSLPASIRDNDPYIADIRAGRLPGSRGSGPAGGGGSTPPLTQNPPSGGSPTIPTFMRRTFASGTPSLQNSGQPRMSGRPGSSPPRLHMPRTRIEPVRQGLIPHYVVKRDDSNP